MKFMVINGHDADKLPVDIRGNSICVCDEYVYLGAVFVKLEELHIATARKPVFHQTQPVACYQHRNQPCML